MDGGGVLCGLGRSKAYAEAQRFLDTDGDAVLPVIRFGRTLRVPTAALLELLGLTDTQPQPRDSDDGVVSLVQRLARG